MTPEQPAKRGRGRPRGAGIIDEEELLERALRALAAGGYRSLSMRGIARELGVSLASVQHRYATKDLLWRAAIDRLVDRATPSGAPPGASFPELLRQRVETAAAYPGLMSSLLSDDAPGHEDRLAHLAERLVPWLTSARETLADAEAAGLSRRVDVDVFIALMLVGVGAVGALPSGLHTLLGLGEGDHERLADGMADLLLFGVVARGPT